MMLSKSPRNAIRASLPRIDPPKKGTPMNLPTHLLRATSAAVLFAASLVPALAADPAGTWLTEEGKATVRVADCGGALCGTIVALKEPNDASGKPKIDKNNVDAGKRNRPIIGVQIVTGLKPDGANKWSGQIYNPEDGKTYNLSVTLPTANTLKVQGCMLGGVLCKTNTWTRS
jgi:uncharacterized protein (DUF2147 family)